MLSMHILLRNSPILRILGQFENLGFVIMSTRENIRVIARTPLLDKLLTAPVFMFLRKRNVDFDCVKTFDLISS